MLPLESKPTAMVTFVAQWFELLAHGDTDAAIARLDEPNCYGITWTAAAIANVLAETFGHARYLQRHPEGPRFTTPATAFGRLHVDVTELDDGSGYLVDHDVPLNEEWSDLTAQFEFLRRDSGYAVVLHDLHVL